MKQSQRASTTFYARGLRLGALASLCLALVVGCDRRAPNDYASPESAVMAFFNAMNRAPSSPSDAWSFLGPQTRARLESLAAEGPEGLDPMSYLRFGWVPDEALIQDIRRVSETGKSVTLHLTTELGDAFEIEMIRAEDGWLAEIGVVPPPAPVAAPAMDEAGSLQEGDASGEE